MNNLKQFTPLLSIVALAITGCEAGGLAAESHHYKNAIVLTTSREVGIPFGEKEVTFGDKYVKVVEIAGDKRLTHYLTRENVIAVLDLER